VIESRNDESVAGVSSSDAQLTKSMNDSVTPILSNVVVERGKRIEEKLRTRITVGIEDKGHLFIIDNGTSSY